MLVPGAARPDDVLLVLVAWAGVGLAGWLALGSLLATLAQLPGAAGRGAGEVADRVTPLAVRKLLTLTLGAAVGSCALPAAPASSGATVPVGASAAGSRSGTPGGDPLPGYAPSDVPARDPVAAPVSGARARVDDGPGFLPTLGQPTPRGAGRLSTTASAPPAVSAPQPSRGPGYLPTAPPPVHDSDRARLLVPAPRVAASTHDLVTVRRGDSLWSIVARHLGPGASDAQVAHEWPHWYAANRAVIGEDPDVLVPGQQLRPPSHSVTRPGSTPTTDSPAVATGARR